jgi:hypothetical protein
MTHAFILQSKVQFGYFWRDVVREQRVFMLHHCLIRVRWRLNDDACRSFTVARKKEWVPKNKKIKIKRKTWTWIVTTCGGSSLILSDPNCRVFAAYKIMMTFFTLHSRQQRPRAWETQGKKKKTIKGERSNINHHVDLKSTWWPLNIGREQRRWSGTYIVWMWIIGKKKHATEETPGHRSQAIFSVGTSHRITWHHSAAASHKLPVKAPCW